MNTVIGTAKAAFAIAYLASAISALTSYVYRDWPWHLANMDALFSAQARPFYLRMIWEYVGLAFMLAVPVALVFALVLSSLSSWLARRLRSFGSLFWVALGVFGGAAAGVVLRAAFGGVGAPVVSGIVGGAVACLLLARPLRRWLLPLEDQHSPGLSVRDDA